ncbi:hypothetical protein CEXT_332181 [Caerostris extrusa]|uniref:Uncharacterized protein n=1 Tax=Caerostris extrusa TaxID=172846 RepID=A0AAV4Y7Y7_CAEEX|nr:hypothetical protein CEXT_332181 [Caerostris extrusa]
MTLAGLGDPWSNGTILGRSKNGTVFFSVMIAIPYSILDDYDLGRVWVSIKPLGRIKGENLKRGNKLKAYESASGIFKINLSDRTTFF